MNKRIIKCEACGVLFKKTTNGRQRYCGSECYEKIRVEKNRAKRGGCVGDPSNQKLNCCECGNTYTGDYRTKYCSQNCKALAKEKRKEEKIRNNPNIWKEKYIRYKDQYSVWSKNYRKKNPGKILELQREYRKNNLEKIRTQEKRQWQKNRVKILEQSRARYQKFRDSLSEEDLKKFLKEESARGRAWYKSLTKEQKSNYAKVSRAYRERLKKDPVKWKKYTDRVRANKKTKPQRDKSAEYARRKRREDLQFAVKGRLRCRVRGAIRNHTGGKAVKMSTTMDLVGCSPSKLIAHLESLFTPEMSWEHFKAGGIHIDHIKPCTSFDLTKESEQRKCFNYKNLQPLWAKDNLSKGAKIAA